MQFDKQQLDQLYRYCYALMLHRDNAYDLLQASLEKFLKQHASQSPKPHSALAYLRRIIRNQFIDTLRHNKCVEFQALTDNDSSEAIPINSDSLENLIINEELVDLVWSILTVPEREIVFLWAIEGFTSTEISAELDLPRGTVLSKIHRLRKKITEQLSNEIGDLENNRSNHVLSSPRGESS